MSKDRYESPLSSRYASQFMLNLFSAEKRIETWRRLWVALARAEHELGLPVTAEPAFAMTETEMEAVLDPKLYTGRCAAQVEAFLEGIAPLLAEAESGDTPEINV